MALIAQYRDWSTNVLSPMWPGTSAGPLRKAPLMFTGNGTCCSRHDSEDVFDPIPTLLHISRETEKNALKRYSLKSHEIQLVFARGVQRRAFSDVASYTSTNPFVILKLRRINHTPYCAHLPFGSKPKLMWHLFSPSHSWRSARMYRISDEANMH